MIKNRKYKYLLLGLALTVVLSTAVFSVSYAMWLGEDRIAASVNVGEWESSAPDIPDPPKSGIGYKDASGNYKSINDIGLKNDFGYQTLLVRPTYQNQAISIAWNGINFAEVKNPYCSPQSSIEIKDGMIIFNEVGTINETGDSEAPIYRYIWYCFTVVTDPFNNQILNLQIVRQKKEYKDPPSLEDDPTPHFVLE